MVDFTMELAGVSLAASVLFESTYEFCKDYLTDAPAQGHITMCEADIDAERIHAAEQDARDGVPQHNWSDRTLEPFALYRKVASALLPFDAIVFHGAVLSLDGSAYLFTAPSGTGKTTHARYWLSQVPGAHVLNGDKPLLRVMGDRVFACGTPWRGKERIGVNECQPLEGLCILERGDCDKIVRIGSSEALPMLLHQTYRLQKPEALLRIVELVGRVGALVPLWKMTATLDERSALVSSEAMTGHLTVEA